MNRRTAKLLSGWVAIALGLLTLTGCEELVNEFRTVAGSNLQQGVLSILTGVVDGAFAVFDPN